MNEVQVNLETKLVDEVVENERDPLALGEEETDPLAEQEMKANVEPNVNAPIENIVVDNITQIKVNTEVSNPTEDTNGSAEPIKDGVKEPEEVKLGIEQVNVDENQILEVSKESEASNVPIESNEKTEIENKSQEIKLKDNVAQDVFPMETNEDKADTKLEINGSEKIENTNIEHKLNGSDKPESYKKLNGDVKLETTRKRSPEPAEQQTPIKKLCTEVQKSFTQHDNMINDYIQHTTKNNVDEIQRHTEQLLSEIETLRELSQKKELEWNNILHLKKVKEEILLRLLRRKQVLAFEKVPGMNGTDRSTETVDLTTQTKNSANEKSEDICAVPNKLPKITATVATQSVSLPTPTPMPPPAHAIPRFNIVPAPPSYDKPIMPSNIPKSFPHPIAMQRPAMPIFGMDFNDHFMARYNSQMGRQGPVKDVKSIIADYRQRHPETVPRRGRRMKSAGGMQGNNSRQNNIKLDSLNNLGMLLNNMDLTQKSMLERLTQSHPGAHTNGSFKDILMHFAQIQQQTASMQAARPQLENILNQQRQQDAVTVTKTDKESRMQNDRLQTEAHKSAERPLNPPPYPEISLHPVVSSSNSDQTPQNSSLLHGILTKQANSTAQTFSPTLAKLLTSPERKAATSSFVQAKSCGEITITPVQPRNKEPTVATEPAVEQPAPLEDEESAAGSEGEGDGEGSGGEGGGAGSRLVIDEGPGAGGDVPACQGCRRRDAQFVCAGCANQWYCSRECQVAAWDDHSDMCSG